MDYNGDYLKDIKLYLYTRNPAMIYDQKKLIEEDNNALRNIAELEKQIGILKQHRIELYEQQKRLEAAPYELELTLKRYSEYNGKKSYHININKIMQDIGTVSLLNEIYTGTERHKAIKRYNELLKQHPNIRCDMNIEKGKWEK